MVCAQNATSTPARTPARAHSAVSSWVRSMISTRRDDATCNVCQAAMAASGVDRGRDDRHHLQEAVGNLQGAQAVHTGHQRGVLPARAGDEAHNDLQLSDLEANMAAGEPYFVDELIRLTGQSASTVMGNLGLLELRGCVSRTPAGAFIRLDGRGSQEET